MASKAESAAQAQETTAAAPAAEVSLLDQIVDKGKMGRDVESKARGKDIIKEFVSQVLQGSMTIAPDTEVMLNARIAQIDRLLSAQLNEVMHAPEFQKLESSWRGLHYMLQNTETSEQLKAELGTGGGDGQ